jgi:isopentenyl-diphosphate Delta-isomerase
MEKIAAHEGNGTLHRAFSVIIANKKGEILLQQRSISKYHCP